MFRCVPVKRFQRNVIFSRSVVHGHQVIAGQMLDYTSPIGITDDIYSSADTIPVKKNRCKT